MLPINKRIDIVELDAQIRNVLSNHGVRDVVKDEITALLPFPKAKPTKDETIRDTSFYRVIPCKEEKLKKYPNDDTIYHRCIPGLVYNPALKYRTFTIHYLDGSDRHFIAISPASVTTQSIKQSLLYNNIKGTLALYPELRIIENELKQKPYASMKGRKGPALVITYKPWFMGLGGKCTVTGNWVSKSARTVKRPTKLDKLKTRIAELESQVRFVKRPAHLGPKV